MLLALTRPVSPSIVDCELTHLAREPIDVARAEHQHAAYEHVLASLGATILHAPPAPEHPDAVFVEDTAIVLDEVAVITRPGAESRRSECVPIAALLAHHRPLRTMTAPATLDGGDVLRLGRTLYAGRSGRTNQAGIAQLREFAAPFGYEVIAVDFSGCLHLKSAATALDDRRVLLNPSWVAASAFGDAGKIEVDVAEPHAANALAIGGALVFPSEFPRTRDRLATAGFRVVTTECAELAKAEGAVTCGSLVFASEAVPPR